MDSAAAPRLEPDEYLKKERLASFRSEYHSGRLVALAGASWRHNLIASNLAGAFNTRFSSGACRAVTSDQRVWSPRSHTFLYPDVVVVCGEPVFHDKERDTLINPTLVVEVLSPTTEAYDRGVKLAAYRYTRV